MTIKEFYNKLGSDFENVKARMMSERLIQKFSLKFLDDKSYPDLLSAYDEGRDDDAFRFAHTLKGVAQNLGFDRLYASSNKLTEALRNGKSEGADGLLEEVKSDYAFTTGIIKEFKEQNGL
ncbi:MAG: Hpt domain-containing protein [Clostridiales bacterium]|nr:Hpt domain-containing protein [Clostridiales bacterium]